MYTNIFVLEKGTCHLSVEHIIGLFTYPPTYQPLFPFRYLTRLPTYLLTHQFPL